MKRGQHNPRNTGNKLAIPLQERYYAEIQVAVTPDSEVEFWFALTGHANAHTTFDPNRCARRGDAVRQL